MAVFLTQYNTLDNIKQIIKGAKKFIVLISPFVDFEALYELIKLKKSEVYTQIFAYKNKYDNSEMKAREDTYIYKLECLTNVSLYCTNKSHDYFDKKFHCKCYFNECRFIVTSMNLSWIKNKVPKYNFESGVLFYKSKDYKQYRDSIDWFLDSFSLIFSGKKQKITDLTNHVSMGHCIHCNRNIIYSKDFPFCYDCYRSLRNFKSWMSGYRFIRFYKPIVENYCHNCGSEFGVCWNVPICDNCKEQLGQ